ncbi:MAG: (S)-ureidoglycine aminohydrolase [Chloroflexi bacterium AL-W]|nr:(S)-ureidoglycine aminohydrolase [Chloroflexi bacterium AL-W]
MKQPLGQTRTTVQGNHAFIAPDSHVLSGLPGWENTQGVILISPQMRSGPRFTQYLALMNADSTSGAPLPGVQRFVYVMAGTLSADLNGQAMELSAGHFAYIPADTQHTFTSITETKLIVFEKIYTSSPLTTEKAQIVTGDAWAGEGEAFMGDEAARLRVLLPTQDSFDMAINLFSFQPGAALPFVEVHVMEHGLYLLEGQGIYRLDEAWYPIQAGDVLWMGSYCPQWFCAFGKTPSTYIYYKDVNRDSLI